MKNITGIFIGLIILLTIAYCSCANQSESSGGNPLAGSVVNQSDTRLAEANRRAGQLEDLLSLLVIQNGVIVSEQYYHGAAQSSVFNVKCVAKSFLSPLVGIAIREKYITGVEQKISDYFPEYSDTWKDPLKREIKIRDLLTLTAGFKWVENGPITFAWLSSNNWVKFALDLSMEYAPGEHFNYDTAESHLLSVIITRATKMSTLEFGYKYFFKPLGIMVKGWDTDPRGYYYGGCEMYFTARDLAKLGILYLNGGSDNGKQIVPAEWVNESIKNQAIISSYGGGICGYGYLWWLRKSGEYDVYFAWGYNGQHIFNIPALNLVVVTTSSLNFPGDINRTNRNEEAIFDLLDNDIIPSLRR